VDNLKEINIGSMIQKRWKELDVSMERTCNFFGCTVEEVERTFNKTQIETDALLKWSKLLEYDFFRLYSHHLILYAPAASLKHNKKKTTTTLPEFRKSVYTKEVIDYIMKQITTNEKTLGQVITEYRIPKTTLYRWMHKYNLK